MESHLDQLLPKGAEADQTSKFEAYEHCELDTADNTQHPALVFVDALDPGPDGRFNIETFTDLPKGESKPFPDPLLTRLSSITRESLKVALPKLHRLNENGAGIFISVNRCNGHRKANSVVKIRAVHADADNITVAQREALHTRLQPSIVVTSSEPDRLQFYWCIRQNECVDKDYAKVVNQILAADYGADPAAIDVSRLLRLPGFKHMKYRHRGQTPTVTATYNNCVYALAEVQNAFPPMQRTPIQHHTCQRSTDDLSRVESDVVAEMKLHYPELWSGAWEQA